METEKGVMIVAYKQSRRSNRFAVLKRKKNWEGWELPKGHLENDDYFYTVREELEEEAGIDEEDVEEIDETEETVSWTYEREGEKFEKKYRVMIAEVVDSARIDTSNNPDEEHEQGFFLSLEDALSLLTYENNKKVLKTAVQGIEE
jgi:8-oxo-dGTP pyrophosphatase MutT (NUDIX family)